MLRMKGCEWVEFHFLDPPSLAGEILPFRAVAEEFKRNRCMPMDADDGVLLCTPHTVGQTLCQ